MSKAALLMGTLLIAMVQNVHANAPEPIFKCNPSLDGFLKVKVKLDNSKYEEFYDQFEHSMDENTMRLGFSIPSNVRVYTTLKLAKIQNGNQITCAYNNGLVFGVTLKCSSTSFSPTKAGVNSCTTSHCSVYCHKS